VPRPETNDRRKWITCLCLFPLVVALHVQAAISYPGDLLNLMNWKLQLPIGQQGSVTEVSLPALNTFADDCFHLNAAQNGVVFKANCGGVTTSGSSYPRSELREMTGNGLSQAAWSTDTGIHSMYIKEAIMHLPDVKPQVVAGQIHKIVSDLIEVRLEGTKLFLEYDTGATVHGAILASNYKLGTVFTLRIVASAGHIKTYYNDSIAPAQDFPANYSGCYFKAGCYTQSNTTKGDSAGAYGEVCVYELVVTHGAETHVASANGSRTSVPPATIPKAGRSAVFSLNGRVTSHIARGGAQRGVQDVRLEEKPGIFRVSDINRE